MDIRFLESLVATVDSGSIAAAARRQGLTSAAVSQRIRAVEQQLGVSLLSRVGHSCAPTEVCLRLLPRARHLVAEVTALKDVLEPCEVNGTLRLGAISTALTDIIPNVVERFAMTAPTAKLVIVPGTSAVLYEMLLNRDIDASLMIAPPAAVPKQFASTVIAHQPLRLITAAGLTTPPIACITERPLILYERTSWGGRLAWQWLKAQNVKPRVLCEMDGLETIALMVERGLGVSIVPEWASLPTRYAVNVIPLSDAEDYARHLILASHRAAGVYKLLTVAFPKR